MANDKAEEYWTGAANHDYERACQMNTPSMMLRPRLFIDGNRWCALLGENIQDGVCGFGASPALAYADFDKHWYKKLPTKEYGSIDAAMKEAEQ